MSVKLSVVVAALLTIVVHHLLMRRAAMRQALRLSIGNKVRRWFDAAAIAVIGTMVLFGAIHWLAVYARGQA